VRTNRSAKTVHPGATRRNSDHADADIIQDSVERRCEPSGSVSDEEPELGEAIAEIHQQVADLLSGPLAVGVGGRAQQVHGLGVDLQHKEHLDPVEGDCAVHVGRSHMPAWSVLGRAGTAARSCRCRGPAPGVSATAFRTRRMVEAPTR